MAKLELTLAILKPDLFMRKIARQHVNELICGNGFFIIHQAKLHLNREKMQQFYSEHEGKFFYKRLVDFMSATPIQGMILAHPNAIRSWRGMMGPTKPPKAQFTDPDSIRGLYGLTDTRNSTHGSDSTESAEREINLVFPNFNKKEWYQNKEPLFRKGPVVFSNRHQVHEPAVYHRTDSFTA